MKDMNAQEMISRWETSETLTLGNHFHGKYELGKDEGILLNPQWRVRCMGTSDFDFEKLSGHKTTIKSIQICMALKEELQRALNIAPLLCLELEEEGTQMIYMELESIEESSGNNAPSVKATNNGPGAAQVPIEFLNVVSNNWMLLGPEQIDDAFMAFKLEHTQGLDRLRSYRFDDKKNTLLFDKLCKLIKNRKLMSLNMHFGIDFNKLPQRSEFTFTPVIELVAKGKTIDELTEHAQELTNRKLSDYNYMPVYIPATTNDDTAGSWFFEYIQPCPKC